MEAAIEEATNSIRAGDYGIGAVIVKDNQIINRAGNRIKLDNDPTHHAEIVAIRNTAKQLNNRFLTGCILYSTHEPCPMCTAAAIWARMDGIVCGTRNDDMIAYSRKNSSDQWSWRTIDVPASKIVAKGDPKLFLVGDFMREECQKLFHTDVVEV